MAQRTLHGRAAGKSQKVWRDALVRALNKRTSDELDAPRRLEHVAEAVVNAALAGDMQAAKEIGDRIDGKPMQQMEVRAGTLDDRSDDELAADIAALEAIRAAIIAADRANAGEGLADAEPKGSA